MTVTVSLFYLYVTILLYTNSAFHGGEIIEASARKRPHMGDKSYKSRIVLKNYVRGVKFCLAECSRVTSCASFFYNKRTKHCQGHTVTLGYSNGTYLEDGSVYYVRTYGEGYIGDSCNTLADCASISNVECRDQTCLCVPGYSFSPKTHECLPNCTVYGSDFLAVNAQYINRNNEETLTNIDGDACRDACINRTSYICRTYEYGRPNFQPDGYCALQSVTKLDVNASFWYKDEEGIYDITHYQRDCN